MEQRIQERLSARVAGFRLPRYEEIPQVGLYLEQVAKYISQYFAPLGDMALTTSMISNYVKMGLIPSPVKKQYSREQVAYLFFIAAAKSVLSMESIGALIRLQKQSYPGQVAYDYFCCEFENVIRFIFGLKESLDTVGRENPDHPEEKALLRTTITTIANKIYLDGYFSLLQPAAK